MNKRMREARMLAYAILARYGAQLEVCIIHGKHAKLVLSSPDGKWSKYVVFASTPSCHLWRTHLQRDINNVMREHFVALV